VIAATLAIGTEVTDGQIIDRNSAWISAKLVQAGIQVIEHRAVADDRQSIELALRELSARVDLLFVTGGLGPTSDDITRDLLSFVFARELEFDDESWRHLCAQFNSRGIQVGENQKRQCFYPKGCRVLTNPAGTANAFSFDQSKKEGGVLRVFALPGPPSEVAAVWELNLNTEIESLVAKENRDELILLRLLGRGEGLESELKPWLVNRNDEDVADQLIDRAMAGERIRVIDAATGGRLTERIAMRIHERKQYESASRLIIESHLTAPSVLAPSPGVDQNETLIQLSADRSRDVWTLRVKDSGRTEFVVEERPVYGHKVFSERGRKFITEKMLIHLNSRNSKV
jgi:molybdenum cofactor synthesis domain-containing protein